MKTLFLSTPLARVLAAAMILLGGISPTLAQPVTFPDPNLETAVRDNLGIPSPTPVTQADMFTLTNLYADWRGIRDTGGLEYASNLFGLYLNGSAITNLSGVAPLIQLRRLHLSSSGVRSVSPLTGLTNLEELNLDWNDATNTPLLAPLSHLTNLWLAANNVSNVSFLSGAKKLQILSLYNNRVSDIAPLAGHTNLIEFNLSWNGNVTNAYYVTNFSKVEHLWLNGDAIPDAPYLGKLGQLLRLGIGNNPITTVAFLPALTNLTYLDVNGSPGVSNITLVGLLTHLTELHMDGVPGGDFSYLAPLTNLIALNVSGTGLQNLNPLLERPALRYLWLGNNPAIPDYHGLATLPWLETLGLWSVPLQDTSFLSGLTNLADLNLSSTQVGDLTPLAGLQNLHWLSVYDCWVSDVDALLPLPSLWQVDLAYNLLDLSPGSLASNAVAQLRSQGTTVYDSPQKGELVAINLQPADVCAPSGANVTFVSQGSNANYGPITYQWQFHGVDLAGETNAALVLTGVTTDQAGSYRAIVRQDWRLGATRSALLTVDATNCNNDITITQPPLNQCAAPGEDVTFSVQAATIHASLSYQWQFNDADLPGETGDTLTLFGVDTNAAGLYRVVLTDDVGTVRPSPEAELKVVEEVVFPDLVLSAAIHNALGIPQGDSISLTALDSLNYLDLSYQGVTNLAGLECARDLTELRLDGNRFGDSSPLGWLADLNALFVNNCGLSSIGFAANLVNLYQFEFRDNWVVDFAPLAQLFNLNSLSAGNNNDLSCPVNQGIIGNLTNLQYLTIDECCVSDFSFVTNLTVLGYLDARQNYLTSASPAAQLEGLWFLNLGENQISDTAPLNQLTNLAHLYFGSNPITNSSYLALMPGLVALGLENTRVWDISALAGRDNLYSLNLGYTGVTNFAPIVTHTNMEYLYLPGNHLRDISLITGFSKLWNLGLDHNEIESIAPLAGMPRLGWVNLEFNRITNAAPLAAPRTNLYGLYLADNRVNNLAPLSGLTNVAYLSIRSNGISDLAPLSSLYRLDWLSMSSNLVTSLAPLNVLANLRDLDLTANLVTDLSPVASLPRMQYLNPRYNLLSTLSSLAALTNVTGLDFEGNQLTNIAGLSGMPRLDWVSFKSNRLHTVQTLTDLPKLNSFIGDANHLTRLTGLAGLPNLGWIWIPYNDLETLRDITNLTTIIWVDVTYNLLNTNSGSAAMQEVAVIQSHGGGVNYLPQRVPGSDVLLLNPEWLGAGGFRFTIQSPAATVFEIRRSDDLGGWSVIGYATNSLGTVTFTDPSAGATTRFYRARQL